MYGQIPVKIQTVVPYTDACQLQSPSMQMVPCAPHVVLQTCNGSSSMYGYECEVSQHMRSMQLSATAIAAAASQITVLVNAVQRSNGIAAAGTLHNYYRLQYYHRIVIV
jgi:hypothetical protein